jgi:hypothetical protein
MEPALISYRSELTPTDLHLKIAPLWRGSPCEMKTT